MNSTVLHDELKRVQRLLEVNNNGFHSIVSPKFLKLLNPSTTTNIEGITCSRSTDEVISPHDWQDMVTKATEINKKIKGKAFKSEAGDILSWRMIAIRNGQGLAVGILKENISRDELHTLTDRQSGITFSFVLPTHSKKKVVRDKKKNRTTPAELVA